MQMVLLILYAHTGNERHCKYAWHKPWSLLLSLEIFDASWRRKEKQSKGNFPVLLLFADPFVYSKVKI